MFRSMVDSGIKMGDSPTRQGNEDILMTLEAKIRSRVCSGHGVGECELLMA
jgi:hypothetical protein